MGEEAEAQRHAIGMEKESVTKNMIWVSWLSCQYTFTF